MLAEIRCAKFLDKGAGRPSVSFDESLNVVLGSSSGSNSIGKSTFLLIVDFAFGGNEYSKCKDVIENVGIHTIDFRFVFDNIDYRFSRSPMDPSLVWKCDASYVKSESVSIDDFRGWLSVKYGMDGLGGTFRSLTSPFFRVYGKDNHDPKRPLSSHPRETLKEGVVRLLRLFDAYGAIYDAQKLLDDAVEAKRVYESSLERNFIAAAKGKTEFKSNEAKILELYSQIAEIEQMEHDNASDLDPLTAEQLSEMKQSLSLLRRRRALLISQIKALDASEDFEKLKTSKDFRKLTEFFPDANIKKLREIEEFHSKLNDALKKERFEQRASLRQSITALDEAITSLQEDIADLGTSSNLTIAVLRRYSELSIEVKQLEDANASYATKNKLKERVKSLKMHQNALTEAALSLIQVKVNDRLAALNNYVCGEGISVPKLSLPKPDSYSFSIPNDSGTGSLARAMALLDIALLELTPLPAIALDTVSSKHISDERMCKILEIYQNEPKQIFLAFDKADSYGEEANRILEKHTVLRLSEGHELFGRSWAKVEAEQEQTR